MTASIRRSVALFVGTAALALGANGQPPQTPESANKALLKEIGYERLKARLKDLTPNGAGVWVAQVEPIGGVEGKLTNRPDLKKVLQGERAGFVLNGIGRESNDTNDHSTSVATEFYGKDSLANGVTRVELLAPNPDFLAWLGIPKGTVRTDTELPKVSSHSYILESPMAPIVRRLDELIDTTGHVAVVAVGKNKSGDPVASLFGSSYNAIVVGLSDGSAAFGKIQDTDDGSGRIKPDIVVPVPQTSLATPIVASAVALLVQAAADDPAATKPIVLKACLLASANREFQGAKLEGGWHHPSQSTNPLHPKLGAGQLDVDQAHRLVTAGRRTPGMKAAGPGYQGWGLGTTESRDNSHTYVIDVPDNSEVVEVSAALTWNRQFVGPERIPQFANFDLVFGMVDDEGQFLNVLEKSASTVDNVELIWFKKSLPPGRYGFRVSSVGEVPGEYGLAWDLTTREAIGVKRPPPPTQHRRSPLVQTFVYATLAIAIVGLLFLLWYFRFIFIGPPGSKPPPPRTTTKKRKN